MREENSVEDTEEEGVIGHWFVLRNLIPVNFSKIHCDCKTDCSNDFETENVHCRQYSW